MVLTTLKTIIIDLRVLISGRGNGCSRVVIYDIVENGVANVTTIVLTLQLATLKIIILQFRLHSGCGHIVVFDIVET